MTVDQLNQVVEAVDSLKLLTEEYEIWTTGDPEEDSPTLQINRAVHVLIEHVPGLVAQVVELETEVSALKAFIEGYRAEVKAHHAKLLEAVRS